MISMFLSSLVVFGIIVILAAWFSPKIYRKIKAKAHAAGDKISKKLSNPEEEAKLIIHEAETEIKDHKNNLVRLMASLSNLENRLNQSKEDVIKWERVAQKAKEKNAVEDVKIAISRKLSAEKNASTLSEEYQKTDMTVKKIQEFIRTHEERLSNARGNMVNLSARQQVVKLREDLLKNATESSGLSALNDLEEMVVGAENEIDAKEVVFGTDSLENRYNVDVSLDEEVEKFMKA